MQTINFNKLNLKRNDLLLDMGCGEGRHTIGAYIEKPVNSFGFDLSYKDLQIAKERLNDFDVSNKREICQFGVGDINALPFKDESYDSVICSEVLEHVDSPEDSIKELIRVLKPGGWGYLSWTNWYSPNGGHNMNPYQYLGPKWGPRLYEKRHGPPPDNRYGEGLFAVHIGSTLRMIRQRTDISITRIEPRYWPWARFIIAIPGLREFFTWNCVIRFTRKN